MTEDRAYHYEITRLIMMLGVHAEACECGWIGGVREIDAKCVELSGQIRKLDKKVYDLSTARERDEALPED